MRFHREGDRWREGKARKASRIIVLVYRSMNLYFCRTTGCGYVSKARGISHALVTSDK